MGIEVKSRVYTTTNQSPETSKIKQILETTEIKVVCKMAGMIGYYKEKGKGTNTSTVRPRTE